MKIKVVKPSAVVVKYTRAARKVKPTDAQVEGESLNRLEFSPNQDIMSMPVGKLWSKMKTSVSDLHSANLSGKQLRRHQAQALIHLGAKQQIREQVPATILRGMRAKAAKRKIRERGTVKERAFITEEYTKKHVQNAAIYSKRPAEMKKEKAKEERIRKYRK